MKRPNLESMSFNQARPQLTVTDINLIIIFKKVWFNFFYWIEDSYFLYCYETSTSKSHSKQTKSNPIICWKEYEKTAILLLTKVLRPNFVLKIFNRIIKLNFMKCSFEINEKNLNTLSKGFEAFFHKVFTSSVQVNQLIFIIYFVNPN